MKNLSVVLAITLLLFLNSCQVVGDIFKAGMGFGIFMVVAVIGIVIFIIVKATGGGK
jgi:hypothetical protein